MRTQFVLIDFENVQPTSLEPLKREHFRVLIFVGASQPKLSFEVVESVQRWGAGAEYIRICGNGANSLDFHIAYYIGKLSSENPSASFHIVSRDTGFDPLIQHLKAKNIHVRRVPTLAGIEAENAPKSKDTKKTIKPEERFDVILNSLKRMKAARPKSVSTLKGTIAALLRRQVSEGEVKELIETLTAKGIIRIDEKPLNYTFPSNGEAKGQG